MSTRFFLFASALLFLLCLSVSDVSFASADDADCPGGQIQFCDHVPRITRVTNRGGVATVVFTPGAAARHVDTIRKAVGHQFDIWAYTSAEITETNQYKKSSTSGNGKQVSATIAGLEEGVTYWFVVHDQDQNTRSRWVRYTMSGAGFVNPNHAAGAANSNPGLAGPGAPLPKTVRQLKRRAAIGAAHPSRRP